MNEPWVVVARRDDLADAEWEAAMLREADIAVILAEAEDRTLELRVEAENARRAEEVLAGLAPPDADDPNLLPESEPEAEQATLTSISPERQKAFARATSLAVIGMIFPPLLFLALVKLLQGYRQPEGMAFVDWFEMFRSAALATFGILFWTLVIIKNTF